MLPSRPETPWGTNGGHNSQDPHCVFHGQRAMNGGEALSFPKKNLLATDYTINQEPANETYYQPRTTSREPDQYGGEEAGDKQQQQKGKGKQVTKGTSHTEAPASAVVGDCGGTCGCVPYRLRVLGMLGSSLSDRDLFGPFALRYHIDSRLIVQSFWRLAVCLGAGLVGAQRAPPVFANRMFVPAAPVAASSVAGFAVPVVVGELGFAPVVELLLELFPDPKGTSFRPQQHHHWHGDLPPKCKMYECSPIVFAYAPCFSSGTRAARKQHTPQTRCAATVVTVVTEQAPENNPCCGYCCPKLSFPRALVTDPWSTASLASLATTRERTET